MGNEAGHTSETLDGEASPEDLGQRLRDASPTGARLFTLLGRTGALEVLYEVGMHGPIRFGELKTRLDVSSATLSARLSELVEAGFIDRTSYDEIPPRVEYTPTESLADFKPVFYHLIEWSERHGFGSEPSASKK